MMTGASFDAYGNKLPAKRRTSIRSFKKCDNHPAKVSFPETGSRPSNNLARVIQNKKATVIFERSERPALRTRAFPRKKSFIFLADSSLRSRMTDARLRLDERLGFSKVSFRILHSALHILHSSSCIPHSAFRIRLQAYRAFVIHIPQSAFRNRLQAHSVFVILTHPPPRSTFPVQCPNRSNIRRSTISTLVAARR